MPMKCLDSDLDAVFASSDFGEANGTVTWRGVTINGVIFDDEDVEVDLGEGVGEIAHRAVLSGPSRKFVGIADGDAVTISGVAYTVKSWLDDGTGVIEIMLKRN